jgi:glycerophosphoryl diester phosphodiesterase
MVDVGPLERQDPLRCVVTAHRGSLHQHGMPDNSLPALQQAARAGIPLLEVDVRRSNEGDLFLFHDGSLNSGNSYSPSSLHGRPISELSRSERAQAFLDPERTIGIPSLEQALELVSSTSSALQLDLKGESDSLALAVVQAVAQAGLLSKVVLQIRKPSRIAMLKQRYPAIRVVARCLSAEQLREALHVGVEMVELERWVSSEAISLAHSYNVPVLLNIASSRLDEPTTHRYLRSRGIDALMTDFAKRDCKMIGQ